MITAHAFIDWDTARRVRKSREIQVVPFKQQVRDVVSCFTTLQERVAAVLMDLSEPVRIIRSRLYHGWHRGSTATQDHAVWQRAAFDLRPHVSGAISYLPDIEYGCNLVCGGPRSVLFDTLRKRDPQGDEQKMVDTALVADLLTYTRSESRNFGAKSKPTALAIVIGDDDDLLPGVFVAEQWGLPVRVLRVGRKSDNSFIKTSGLISRI